LDVLTLFTLALVAATASGWLFRYLKLSPVIAYIIAGIVLNYFDLNLDTTVFNFLSTLAVQLLAFRIGLSFDASTVKNVFGKAIVIVLAEVFLIASVISAVSSLMYLNLGESVLLFATAINASSSILFKQSRGKIPNDDFEVVMATSSLEDIVAFGALAILTGQLVNVYNGLVLFLEGLASFGLGLGLTKFLLSTLSSKEREYSQELLFLAAITLVLVFTLLGEDLKIPEVLPPLVLGIATSYAFSDMGEDKSELESRLSPLNDFFLVIFFLLVGQSVSLSYQTLLLLPLSLGLIALKYVAFSTGYWIVSGSFQKAFITGINMTALSEFGIVVGVTAISLGYNLGSVFDLVVMTFGASVILSGFLVSRLLRFSQFFINLQKKSTIIRTANALLITLHNRLKIPGRATEMTSLIIRFIIYLSSIIVAGTLSLGLSVRVIAYDVLVPFIEATITAGVLISSFYAYRETSKGLIQVLGVSGESAWFVRTVGLLAYLLFALAWLSILGALLREPYFDFVMIGIIVLYVYLSYIRSKRLRKPKTEKGKEEIR
jgi:Kef-type K+ transport systems, membrane components